MSPCVNGAFGVSTAGLISIYNMYLYITCSHKFEYFFQRFALEGYTHYATINLALRSDRYIYINNEN